MTTRGGCYVFPPPKLSLCICMSLYYAFWVV
jgi:hypothetical protein